jgi:hypothetical protein
MNYRNKPRVFLSHSKKDAKFIERAAADFRRCHIDPWLDTEEIRHGRPWLSEIFESGIPACDCLLVYLTKHSVNSAMVRKEMDAGFVQKLRDQQVALLPYVADGALRDQLRLDVQSLQTPEWNDANYDSIFPRIVAEIWRAYLERVIPATTAEERARRLEAELAIEKLRRDSNAGVFAKGEEKDFAYIRKALSGDESFVLSNRNSMVFDSPANILQTGTYNINILSFVLHLAKEQRDTLEPMQIANSLAKLLKRDYDEVPKDSKLILHVDAGPDIADLLRIFGFATWIQRMEPKASHQWGQGGVRTAHYYQIPARRTVFTEKIHRFRYWLAMNDIDVAPARLVPVVPFDLRQLE